MISYIHTQYIYIYIYIYIYPSRFHHVSVNVSTRVSVNVSGAFRSTFQLRFRWAGVCPTETIQKLSQRFRCPLSIYIYIYIYICISSYT